MISKSELIIKNLILVFSCEIERMLISKKFPLTPAEEERFSTLPETRIERKVLKCLQTENYSPFENVEYVLPALGLNKVLILPNQDGL